MFLEPPPLMTAILSVFIFLGKPKDVLPPLSTPRKAVSAARAKRPPPGPVPQLIYIWISIYPDLAVCRDTRLGRGHADRLHNWGGGEGVNFEIVLFDFRPPFTMEGV